MKKLLFAVCALAAISLLAPSAGFANTPDPAVWNNRIGFYTTATADGVSLPSMAPFTGFNVYMVLCNPTAEDGSSAAVDAYECTVTVTGPAAAVVLRLSVTVTRYWPSFTKKALATE